MNRMAYFIAKVDYNGPIPESRPELGRCHLWTASKNSKGYGLFFNERNQKAHAWIWEETHGPKGDLTVDHLCYNTSCVNVLHLELKTRSQNSKLNGQARRTHCINGHKFNEENTRYYKTRKGSARACRVCDKLRPRR